MKKLLCTAVTTAMLVSSAGQVFARDWYVSKARGKGKKGSIKKPAKDLGNIIKKLSPGDVIHIAAGIYTGKGDCGVYEIKVPVSIIGGYDDNFTTRDPWGANKTILTGVNKTKNYKVGARLAINLMKYREADMPPVLVDGLIIDQGAQNRYKTDKKQKILRMADPKTGANPTPDRGALVVTVVNPVKNRNGSWNITVRNNIILNSAPTKGVLHVGAYKNSKVEIYNNVILNNTGSAIYADTKFHGSSGAPEFNIHNNTVLFTWKYDAMSSSFSGISLEIHAGVKVRAVNNIFAFADRFGIEHQGKLPLLLKGNIIRDNIAGDYHETAENSKIALADIEDEAEYLDDDSEGNGANKVPVPISKDWLKLYGSRVLIDRNAVEADIKVQKTRANALRSMLGLPLQAGTIKGVEGDVWLPLLPVEEAVKVAEKYLVGKFGASKELIK